MTRKSIIPSPKKHPENLIAETFWYFFKRWGQCFESGSKSRLDPEFRMKFGDSVRILRLNRKSMRMLKKIIMNSILYKTEKMRVENSTKTLAWKNSSLCPETSTQIVRVLSCTVFHLWKRKQPPPPPLTWGAGPACRRQGRPTPQPRRGWIHPSGRRPTPSPGARWQRQLCRGTFLFLSRTFIDIAEGGSGKFFFLMYSNSLYNGSHEWLMFQYCIFCFIICRFSLKGTQAWDILEFFFDLNQILICPW